MKSFHLETRNFRQSKIANCSPYFITLQVINNIEAEVACEQALLFWASETSLARTRERAASERRSARIASFAQIGELARRLKLKGHIK